MEMCYVFLPVYNGSKFLKQTIDSVLAQTWTNFLLIVYDDCSTDNSVEIVREYMKMNKDKIRFFQNENNLGVGNTLYNCYKDNHDADYFATIGHDDIWSTDYLENQIEGLKTSNCIASFAKIVYIDEDGKKFDDSIFGHNLIYELNGHDFFLRLIHNNFLCASGAVVKISGMEEKIIEFWGYNNDRLQDYELWLHLCLYGEFLYNQEPICYYRRHRDNFSDETKRVIQGKIEFYSTLRRVFFSTNFIHFLNEARNKEKFIDTLLVHIIHNIPYSNLLKILLIDLCEYLLNKQYHTQTLVETLMLMYMDSGMTTKCLKDGRTLPAPIELVECGQIKNSSFTVLKEKSKNFIIHTGHRSIHAKAFSVAEPESMEYLLNQKEVFHSLINNQLAVICNDKEKTELAKTFPNILLLDADWSPSRMEQMLVSFIEDHTHMYRNGLFDMITFSNTPEISLRSIQLITDEKIIRKIKYLDYEAGVASYFTSAGDSIGTIESDHDCTLLENNVLDDGVLCINCVTDIDVRIRIVVNNKMYVCQDIIVCDNGEKIMRFGKLCFFNDPILPLNEYKMSGDLDVMAKNIALQNNYTALLQSRTYKVANVMVSIIRKLHLNRFMIWSYSILKRLYRSVQTARFKK